MMATDTASSPLALLFTDARGRIVFVDNQFLAMLDFADAESLVGSPLHTITGVESAEITRLMQDVARTGYVHERPFTLHGPTGTSLDVLCSSVATYNERGEFIGADITLHSADDATEQDGGTAPAHRDVVQTRIQQIQMETEAREQAAEHIFLQLYFTAQLNALEVLLARMGGPRIHQAVEQTFNETAAKHHWAVRVHGGQIMIDPGEVPADAYRTLLRGVLDYGANVVGRSALLREIKMVESHLDEHALRAAEAGGLRSLIR